MASNLELAQEIFRAGLSALVAKDYETAEKRFLEALELAPGRPSILANLSTVHSHQGRLSEALTLARQAAQAEPGEARHHHQKGALEYKLRLYEAARQSLRTALELNPENPEALNLMGLINDALGDNEAAIACFEQALMRRPHFADASNNLGVSLKKLGRLEAALASFRKAIAANPRHTEALNNCANTLGDLKQDAEALPLYLQAIALNPGRADIYINLGVALNRIGKPKEAYDCYHQAIELDPNRAPAYLYRGMLLLEMDKPQEAKRDFEQVVKLDPGSAQAWSNLGTSFSSLGLHEEAFDALDRAIAIDEHFIPAYQNRGRANMAMDKPGEALSDFDKGLALDPDNDQIKYNKGLALLQMGLYQEGLPLYRYRWSSTGFDGVYLDTTIPEWTGEPFTGRLLLWAEQGIGDEIIYASLLSRISGGQMEVTLAADRRLHTIFARSFPEIKIVDRAQQHQLVMQYERQAPMANLPELLRVTPETLPLRRYPYLTCNDDRKARLAADNPFLGKQLTCGIAWRSANKKFGSQKSIELSVLEPVLTLPNVTFVNLQYGNVKDEIESVSTALNVTIHQAAALDVFSDIEGLLSLIANCDLVITTSNVTAHLAGSIGKKTLLLLPAGKTKLWYWERGHRSRWYPSIELIHQDTSGNWERAIQAARDRMLAHLVSDP